MAEVNIKLRIAEPNEFAIKKGEIIIGKLFFLKSVKTGKFDTGVYYTNSGMNLDDLRSWFINEMVYVPVNPIDSIKIKTEK